MTVPDPQAIRDAADRAEQLLTDAHGRRHYLSTVTAPSELLSVLVPAARTAADLREAVGDPDRLRLMAAHQPADSWGGRLRRIADAAAAARGDRTAWDASWAAAAVGSETPEPAADLDDEGLRPMERTLYELMSMISEECYCAGWMGGTEDAVWRLVWGDLTSWGQGPTAQARALLSAVRMIAEDQDTWIVWDDGPKAVRLREFVPADPDRWTA